MVFLEDREEKERRGAETKIQAWKMLGIKKNFKIPDWDLYRKEAWLQVKPKSQWEKQSSNQQGLDLSIKEYFQSWKLFHSI